MPSSPSVGRKLPQLKLRIRRSRSICSTGRFVFVVFTIILIAVLLFALPRFPARSGTIALGRRGVEDTYRSSEAWNSGKIQQNPFNVNRTDDDKGDSLEQNTESRPKVLGVVGIQTGFGSYERRKALRDTWMPSSPEGLSSLEQSTGLAIRFVIGHTPDATKMAELEKEIKIYKDFIRIDVDEDYHKLTFKTLAFFKAAYQLFDADFYVKADDDIYLRPDRLATLLAKDRSASRTYLGCMKKGPVITDPRQKWYEPLGYLLGNEYFYHAYGPIYALSAEVVSGLTTMKSNSFRMFSNEDVTIGAWMLAMNVEHEDNRAICQPSCTADSIAVWDIPKCSGLCNAAEKLRELHHMDICSKSPTLAD